MGATAAVGSIWSRVSWSDDREQVGRAGRIEELRADRDTPCLNLVSVHGMPLRQSSEPAGAKIASMRSRLAAGHSFFVS